MEASNNVEAKAIYTLALAIVESTGKTYVSYELREAIKAMQEEFKQN
ncbi:hypothetical protein [Thalassobacillus devorans]|nr:hypothetical protein [Thalassobacillus devorans]